MAAPFNADQQATFDKEIAKLLSWFPPERKQAAMMMALRVVQDLVGWVPPEGMEQVAQKLEVHPSKVLEVATFYVMFHTKKPGKYVVDVCTNISCSLCGAEKLLEALEKKLDVHAGETTADGKFTLEPVYCLGQCAIGPNLTINDELHARVDADKFKRLIQAKREA